jgi:SAM-dependent methyltransferase
MDEQAAHEWNRRVYDSAAVVEMYATSFVRMGLLEAEKRIIAHLGDRIVGRSVLDIGVGGGRTAPHLHAIAGRYLGIDYAPEMIRRCRGQFPGLEFRCCDARHLECCDSESFEVAWFSFNGIDYAFPADRIRIIEEVRRVLRPGGTFAFCSHNVRARPWRPRPWPRLVFDGDPRQLIGRNLAALRDHLASHFFYQRNRRREVHGDGYAMRVDQAHEYRLLTYHVSLAYQVGQLAASGFGEVEVFGKDGTPRGRDEDPTDAWLYYLARKPETSRAGPDPA